MIPYSRQSINVKDVRAVQKTLRSDFLTQGPQVLEFEKKLAQITGAAYAVAVANGTAGLHIAYLAAGLGEGDEVITTPNTFVATTNMLLVLGAKPVFCDIRDCTYNIDERLIEKKITSKTKAIVPVHFAGQPCHMKEILRIAKKHGLLVIEDACHALGASYKGKSVGSIGDMTVMSFHPVKSITTGEGGAVLTNNKKLYEKLLSLRSHGIHKDKNGFNVMTEMGYNYRITDIQCALGNSQLDRLSFFVKERNKKVSLYTKYFGENPPVILPQIKEGNISASHLYVVRVRNEKDRLPLYQYLKEKEIGVNFHYPAVYSHPYYRKNGFAKTQFPMADLYAKTAISLPIYPALTEKQIRYIVQTIEEYFNKENGNRRIRKAK